MISLAGGLVETLRLKISSFVLCALRSRSLTPKPAAKPTTNGCQLATSFAPW